MAEKKAEGFILPVRENVSEIISEIWCLKEVLNYDANID